MTYAAVLFGGMMEELVAIRHLSFGTVFKIVFWAGACVWLAVAVLVALVAFLVPTAITINGVEATSPMEALPAVPIFLIAGLIATSIFATLGSGLLRMAGSRLPLGNVRKSE